MENEKRLKIAISMLVADLAFFAFMTVLKVNGQIELIEWVLCFIGDVLIAVPLAIWLLIKSR